MFGPLIAAVALALPGIPADVQGYRTWTKLNAEPIPPRASDPHHGVKNVWVKPRRGTFRPSGQLVYPLPYGSVVVKTATPPGRDFVSLVAIMRKQRGAAPRHNDWRMVEYTRSSPRDRFSRIAGGGVCYSCHVGARKTDYVFTRRPR